MRPISIEELCDGVYEDLNGQITAVKYDDAGLRVAYGCDDWLGTGTRRQFEILFRDVAESTATPSASEGICIEDNHPLLWNHNSTHRSMYFSSAPDEPERLIGQLYEAHMRLHSNARELSGYLHADSRLLRGGYGLFAQGPSMVIDEYARLCDGRLSYSIVPAFTPKGGYRVALFDDCFVVFRDATVCEHLDVTKGHHSF